MSEQPAGFRERLSMIDETGHRRFIIPAEVKGFFKTRKRYVHIFLLVIFLILPWIQIGGHQAVLLSLNTRQFFFFGLHLKAHDAPLVFFVLLALTMALALVTALWGRVWCGWACPQTVFIESLYRQIEIWTEGNYLQRRKLQDSPMSFAKFRKVGLKWLLFTIVSFITAHSFLAYWTGSKELLSMMGTSPSENSFYFMLVMIMTGVLLFNFGWFREQFCLIMCPYGRFQSVLMDSHTVNVMYDEKRGEPRKSKTSTGGDCVSCQRCVQVCPTGIDIRNGIQMECIGCTACIDACDEIMTKVKKPTGLIRYKAQTTKPVKWLRSRVLAYAGVFLFSVAGLGVSLMNRHSVRVEILRAKGVPYQILQINGESWVQNQYLLRIENQSQDVKQLELKLDNELAHSILPANPVEIQPGSKKDYPLFIEIKKQDLISSSLQIQVELKDTKSNEALIQKIQIIGP